jgi:hypothetical protein
VREGCTRARRGRARASVRGRSAAPGRCRRRRSGVPRAGRSRRVDRAVRADHSRGVTVGNDTGVPGPLASSSDFASKLASRARSGGRSVARPPRRRHGRRTRTRPWPGTSSQRCLLGGGWRCGRPNRGRVPVRRAATVTRASSSSWPKRKPRARFRSSGRAHSRRPRLGGRPVVASARGPGVSCWRPMMMLTVVPYRRHQLDDRRRRFDQR